MTRTLIGVDVGGTRTTAAVSDSERITGRAEGAGGAVRPGRALASAAIIAEVTRRALAASGRLSGDVLVVGAAGAGRELERDELRKTLRGENLATKVVVMTDIEIALAAAFAEGPGIVVSAGTGSVAVGRNRAGGQFRIGGYGWQMGDEGSGYAIGRAALGVVSRAADGRSPRTALSGRVLSATRSPDLDALVRWAAGASPAEVAALAPHVLDVAEQGDALAAEIAEHAARELSQLALCLLPKIRTDGRIGVAITGGLLSRDGLLRRSVLSILGAEPLLEPLEKPVDAVLGALRLAEREPV